MAEAPRRSARGQQAAAAAAPLPEFAPWPSHPDKITREGQERTYGNRRNGSEPTKHTDFMCFDDQGTMASRPVIDDEHQMDSHKPEMLNLMTDLVARRMTECDLEVNRITIATADLNNYQAAFDLSLQAHRDAQTVYTNANNAWNAVQLQPYAQYDNQRYTRSNFSIRLANNNNGIFGEMQVRQKATLAHAAHVSLSHTRKQSRLRVQKARLEQVKDNLMTAYTTAQTTLNLARTANEARRAVIMQSHKDIMDKSYALALDSLVANEHDTMTADHEIQRRLRWIVKFPEWEVPRVANLCEGGFLLYDMGNEDADDQRRTILASNGSCIEFHVLRNNTVLIGGFGCSRQAETGVCGEFEALEDISRNSQAPNMQHKHSYKFADVPNNPSANSFCVGGVDYVVKNFLTKSLPSKVWKTMYKFRQTLQPQIAAQLQAHGGQRILKQLIKLGFMVHPILVWTLNADLGQNALWAWLAAGFIISHFQHVDLKKWVDHKVELGQTDDGTPTLVWKQGQEWQKDATTGKEKGLEKCKVVYDLIYNTKFRQNADRFPLTSNDEPSRAVTRILQTPWTGWPTKKKMAEEKVNEPTELAQPCVFFQKVEKNLPGLQRMAEFLTDPLIPDDALNWCRHFKAAQLFRSPLEKLHCRRIVSKDILLGRDPNGYHLPLCCPYPGNRIQGNLGPRCNCRTKDLNEPLWINSEMKVGVSDALPKVQHMNAIGHYSPASDRTAVQGRVGRVNAIQAGHLPPVAQGKVP